MCRKTFNDRYEVYFNNVQPPNVGLEGHVVMVRFCHEETKGYFSDDNHAQYISVVPKVSKGIELDIKWLKYKITPMNFLCPQV